MRVTPVAVASILFCTAVPVELRAWTAWTWSSAPTDFAANLLLYAPLGWGLRSHGALVALTTAVMLSSGVEFLQGGMVGRHPGIFDIVANVAGAMFGFAAARRLGSSAMSGPVAVTPGPSHIAIAALFLCALIAVWFTPGQPSDLSSWEDGYPLLLGNERNGERPWHGTIHQLAIVPAMPSPAGQHRTTGQTDGPPDSAVWPLGTWRLPRELDFSGGNAWIAPESVSAEFARAARKIGGFTVFLTLTPDSAVQSGPARFVSLSDGFFLRNFDIGQEGRSVMFRVRTPVSGRNGMEPFTSTDAVLSKGQRAVITATYDGSISRIHVDGRLHGRTNLAAASCMVPSLCDTDVPAALGSAGALLTLVSLGYLRSRGAIAIGIVLGSVAASVLYYVATLATARPYFSPAPLWSLAGATAIAWSCRERIANGNATGPGETCVESTPRGPSGTASTR